MNKKYSLSKEKIKILLLEGIHESAMDFFHRNDYTNIEYVRESIDESELKVRIRDTHILGIRSRTEITKDILQSANALIAIGCYSIGTDQVDLHWAKMKGIPVFNAPFSNTRSVAELVMGECIFLLRKIPEKNHAAHNKLWLKDSVSSFEVRGKNIGIVGYGHIGSQVSILAESLGMNVYYFDIEKKLSLGNAKPLNSLDELLTRSDILTLHVPETPLTYNMITGKELSLMKKGSNIINASRGSVVKLDDLAEYIKNGHIAGAAVDVFPDEPSKNGGEFINVLQNLPNVILTPHIGGSTAEAQENIALEVSEKLLRYSNVGSTIGATNFVEISLSPNLNTRRYLHIHENKPGMLNRITGVFVSKGLNISAQYLQTDPFIGYVILDIDGEQNTKEILSELRSIPGTIRTRLIL